MEGRRGGGTVNGGEEGWRYCEWRGGGVEVL